MNYFLVFFMVSFVASAMDREDDNEKEELLAKYAQYQEANRGSINLLSSGLLPQELTLRVADSESNNSLKDWQTRTELAYSIKSIRTIIENKETEQLFMPAFIREIQTKKLAYDAALRRSQKHFGEKEKNVRKVTSKKFSKGHNPFLLKIITCAGLFGVWKLFSHYVLDDSATISKAIGGFLGVIGLPLIYSLGADFKKMCRNSSEKKLAQE